MIFNETRFLFLFVAMAFAFFVLPKFLRRWVLIASGVLFYWWYDRWILLLVLDLVLLTYWASGRWGIWLNAAALIWLIGYFKFHGLEGMPGILTPEAAASALIVPLGLSFLSFELIHFCAERSKGKISPQRFSSVAAFGFYFPCRMAGPIKRYQPFEDSIDGARWSWVGFYRGFTRIVWGWFKKVVIADVVGLVVPELHWAGSSLQVIKGLLAYSFYIYLDFSAYSDMAIGMSQILGLRVPENFRLPYLSRNIREFWSRWHMSLSSWLADYLFLPVSRRLALAPLRFPTILAVVIGYLVTFAVCGLWHGPFLNFALWGLYHGILLSLYALYKASGISLRSIGLRGRLVEAVGRIAAPALTFATVTMGWLLFAVQLPKARSLWAILIKQ
ncbi:MAG: MBOAT family protein [Candidatus Omnitrophica bacterium]|nr:MBOAT family protein [Candidatus Omnitrophota bacterium]